MEGALETIQEPPPWPLRGLTCQSSGLPCRTRVDIHREDEQTVSRALRVLSKANRNVEGMEGALPRNGGS